MTPKQCERCKGTFEYDELDLHNGEWLCFECEEELSSFCNDNKQLKIIP